MQQITTDANATRQMMQYDANKKSVGVAYLLWFLLGGFGGHRFYTGRTGSGISILLLCLLSFVLSFVFVGLFGFIILGIWWVVDAFLIPGWIREHNSALAMRIS